ncbi:M28 family metallopeptidase [Goodfellowiella coeruleoviolacea]|uniref:Aminopeptidase Y Metallo peptidase, MEROPS family M28A n=1 Tax=Goodfellowiella coeruleoviolacea TaxID=334858 RepID=A0AAE3GA04_9PSEU|nr:M28 family metallopeptidase [Goodfellowiella coeruleoviolacea]MCP2164417.1 aminopeptidase Y Metallo peptidase, MEROPS family M28A [Goodfellowiella coeruleoviolacea]
MPVTRVTTRVGTAAVAVAATVGLACAPASASTDRVTGPLGPALARQLTSQVSADGVNRHLLALQRIADRNGGTRAVGTKGYDDSVDYVAGKLNAAGYQVSTPLFTYHVTVVDAGTANVAGQQVEAVPMEYSPQTQAGGVTGPLVAVPQDDSPGCQPEDFAGLPLRGAVALIRRGGCTFADKQRFAAEAGAAAVLIANNVDGRLAGVTLGSPDAGRVPTAGISRADGDVLFTRTGASTTVDVRYHRDARTARNVIAQTRTGRTDNVVMAGAHLDGVEAGPGINDNGSGSAGLLETALRLGGSPSVSNAVRFAWWGAEELGLVGSTEYVRSLSFEQQLDIALYLNFDMIGSPNSGYFAYDGDNSSGTNPVHSPYGSAQIERAFVDYLSAVGVAVEDTPFNGRSDYGEFIAVGIPAGGLFTGAEVVKTQAQADKWGGRAGAAFDPCYHQACDTLGNIDRAALGRNADALAWVVASYALSTEDVNGVPARAQRAAVRGEAAGLVAASQPAVRPSLLDQR